MRKRVLLADEEFGTLTIPIMFTDEPPGREPTGAFKPI